MFHFLEFLYLTKSASCVFSKVLRKKLSLIAHVLILFLSNQYVISIKILQNRCFSISFFTSTWHVSLNSSFSDRLLMRHCFFSRDGNLEFDFNERTADKVIEFMKE